MGKGCSTHGSENKCRIPEAMRLCIRTQGRQEDKYKHIYRGGAKYPPYFQLGIVKGGEAVEGWGWARKVQAVWKFPLQPSPVVKMAWSNEQGAACVPYSLPNPPSGPSSGPKIHSVVG
jgi:hypothetical protein